MLINEVQAANRTTFADPMGRTPDWVELYNPSGQSVDLLGMRLAIAGKQHVIGTPLRVPSKGHLVLWCSGHPERGSDHVGFVLPRTGGTLLLIDADGTTITDLFSWSALDTDISMGRLPDGARDWSYFEHPTPGSANTTPEVLKGRTRAPRVTKEPGTYDGPITVVLDADPGAQVRYTLDGRTPARDRGEPYMAPIHIEGHTVVRAIAVAAGELPSREFCGTYVIGGAHDAVCLVLDPEDLEGGNGINVHGDHANHTRSGPAWERPAHVSFPGVGGAMLPVGARISGSGSRGLAKRSFKLVARDRYDSPKGGSPFGNARFREGVLRADAGPHAFLRNLLMEELVSRYGLQVDVQPSVPVPLYLNDRYWGTYRWMPPKDAQWLKHLCGAGAVDVLEGPGGVVRSGSAKHFRIAQQALFSGASAHDIDELIEIGSLIDLACLDLWSGRPDHDLNVRNYRPRVPGGRWRWVLFDMDMWAPADENSLERMCSATVPETPYLPYLLAHPELSGRFLARITALQATVFTPAVARPMADSMFHVHAGQLRADHRRWELELGNPEPEASLQELIGFIEQRPGHLMRHLADHTGRRLSLVTVEAPSPDLGRVFLEGLELPPGRQQVWCLGGVSMHLEAKPAPGVEFAGWKGVEGNAPVTVQDLSGNRQVKALFRRVVP